MQPSTATTSRFQQRYELGEALGEGGMSEVLAATDTRLAHRARIVHCDIKPSNVLLARDSAKVADFGIARAGGGLEKSTGELFGTPAYVAPECLVGKAASPATDVYSVGVMLYQMLTGEPPFRGESAGAVLRSVGHGAHRPLHVVRPDAGPALCHTVERAIATRPSDRFASAFEMASSLPSARALREGADRAPLPLPLVDQTRALVVRPQRRTRRRRRIVVPAAALAAAVGVLFAVVAASGGRAPEPAPTTVTATPATGPPTTVAPVLVRPPAVRVEHPKPAKGAH